MLKIYKNIKKRLSIEKPVLDPNSTWPDSAWVDEFIAKVKPYIFVRLEDNLLIRMPNQAQKLNPTGAQVLKSLLDGMSIQQLMRSLSHDPTKQRDTLNFLHAIRLHLEGKSDKFPFNSAVETSPFSMKFSDYPVLSEIAITYRCNLRCRFCYAGCNCSANPTGSDQEMTAAQIQMVLDKIFHQAKTPSVSFTGGEPTLRPELPELIGYAKKLGMRVNLITNGVRIDRDLAQHYADCGLDSAQVSLEGISADTHEAGVGVTGVYSRTIEAVGHLKAAGIHAHTNLTITRLNLPEVDAFPGFVKRELGGDRFSMNLIIPTGSAAINDDLIVSYSEIRGYLERIIDRSEQENVEFMWYSPMPMCMFNSILHGLGNKGCSACDGLISVGANGDVLPCASFDDPVGNLLRLDFREIWQSAPAKRYRAKALAHPICQKCEDFYICNGACPLYWRQIGYDELYIASSGHQNDSEKNSRVKN
ncbi:MAG: hypothetical protein B6244_00625 [Candidatus Cloacimonetes bacterium 4572_55]|nr:MAG: hypothetical protein B6244_00625 [Candidatus Cloacimonetes bacterium 4572_55]